MTPTIPQLVRDAAERYGDAEAVVDGDRRVSFVELADRVTGVAAWLSGIVEPGDRVGIWAPNSLEWMLAGLGALSAGASLVPLNTRYKGAEAAYILGKSGATHAFVSGEFLGTDYAATLAHRLDDLPALRGFTVLDELPEGGDVTSEVDRRIAAIAPEDVSDVLFTSGTTGHPKGVPTTHHQTVGVFAAWSEIVGLAEGDRYLGINPFFHTFGYKAGIVACLLRGAAMLPQAVFDVPTVLDVIDRERITAMPGPPTLYSSILEAPERADHDLSSLRLAVTGAAVVPVVLVERMRSELSFETVLTAYGLTEATGTVTVCRRGDDPVTIATTSGRAIPDTEVHVVDADGQEVPRGEPGEVVVRGYHVMRGYLDDPEATAHTIDADGWLHTGDVGVMDDGGNVRITDRIKDMYVVGGFNAYPAEIEQTIATHPAVADVAVVGVPDERLGEVGRAFVVLRAGCAVDEAELVGWCRERMANFKAPRSVVVVDALPRNASGKVLKTELREPS